MYSPAAYRPLLFVLLLVLFSVPSAHAQSDSAQERPPNILLIVSDDQGYGDFSAYGGAPDANTPQLDRLAAAGTRFTNGYVTSSICSPSRAALITGRYQQRWGSYNYSNTRLPDDELTLAELLQQKGYATGIVGKSHYGPSNGPGAPGFPLQHGFQTFFGREGGTLDYVRHSEEDASQYSSRLAAHMGVGPYWENDRLVDKEGYSTDLFTDRALSFIDEHREEPFFLMLSFNEVHLFTHQLADEHLAQHDLEKVPELDAGTEDWNEYLEWYVNTVEPKTPNGRKRYLIHLQQLDEAVGAVLSHLDQTNLAENTLIVYVSDNGGSPNTYSDNAPLRGSKYNLEEGGIRIPFVVSWPGHLPEGRVSDELVSTLDVFPTVAAAAGVDIPAGHTLDGLNLLPHIAGEESALDRETLYWTGFELEGEPSNSEPGSPRDIIDKRGGDRTGWAIRDGDYKLRYFGKSGRYGLYDLAADPGESQNLAKQMPDKVRQLRQQWQSWHDNISADYQTE